MVFDTSNPDSYDANEQDWAEYEEFRSSIEPDPHAASVAAQEGALRYNQQAADDQRQYRIGAQCEAIFGTCAW